MTPRSHPRWGSQLENEPARPRARRGSRAKTDAARSRARTWRWTIALAALFSAVAILPIAAQGVTAWNTGDVFAGVGNGRYNVYDNAGTFKETISQGTGGFTTGCSFNNSESHLYTTNFTTNTIHRFQNASPHLMDLVLPTPGVTPPPDTSLESISFMASGNYLVGHADGGSDVHQYTEAGVLVAEYDVATETRGSDWIDLAANQTTLFYTSEGKRVLRFDIGTNTQMADFATGLPGSNAFALRILPPGDGSGGVLVADREVIVRLNGAGAVVQTYDQPGEDLWFALNLDPNGTSFWSGDAITGNFYRFNIATGAVEVGPINSGAGFGNLNGLCLKGEPTAGGGGGPCPDEDGDDDGMNDDSESLVGNLVNDSDTDDDGILDGNDDGNGNGVDDEDEDDDDDGDDDDDCPDDSDGDGEDDEDEDDDEDDD